MSLIRHLFACTVLCATAWGDPPLYPDTLKLSIPAPPTGARADVQLGASVAADGAFVAVGVPVDCLTAERAGSVRVLDANTGALLRVVRNPNTSYSDDERFGAAVAISQGKLVVGAYGNDSDGIDAGRVYVYDLTAPPTSGPMLVLSRPSPGAGDYFGSAVSISGSRIIVWAPYRKVGANTAGIAYTYDLTSATPAQPTAILPNPAPDQYGHFGAAVGISGTRAVVGAPGAAQNTGRAYAFDLAGATPAVPSFTFTNPNAAEQDNFGSAVAIDADRVAIAAPMKDLGSGLRGVVTVYDWASPTPAVPAFTLLNPGDSNSYFGAALAIQGTRVAVGAPFMTVGDIYAGSVYAYDVAGASPTVPVATLNNPTPAGEDLFGLAVAIGAKLVVGAPYDDERAENAGSAYLYPWPAAGPSSPTTYNQPSPSINEGFGFAMASSGARVLIGAPAYDTNDPAIVPGSARLFDLAGPTPGTPVVLFENPTPAQRDCFGWSVAMAGRFAAIGAPYDETAANDAGAVYIYDLQSASPSVPILTLLEPGAAARHEFGASLAMSGTRLAVGAPNSGDGVVYVYDLSSATPGVPAFTLPAPEAAARDGFGRYVAMDGTRLVAGRPNDFITPAYACVFDLSGAGPGAPKTVLLAPSLVGYSQSIAIQGTRIVAAGQGQAEIYDLNSATPGQPVRSLSISTNSNGAVALHGDMVAVGCPMSLNTGLVQVFDLTDSPSPFATYWLENPDPQPNDWFGTAVAFVGGSIVAGAYGDDTTALNKGAAYVFGPAQDDMDDDGLLDLWELAHFGSRAPSAADDSDLDGYNELAEMALDQDPSTPDGAARQALAIEGGYLTLTVAKRAGASYLVESAATPAAADFSTTTTTVLVDNATTLKVRDNFPIGTPGGRFLRSRISPTP